MAVPAHDERDFAFATKYDLPIEWVIKRRRGRGSSALYRRRVYWSIPARLTAWTMRRPPRQPSSKRWKKRSMGDLKVNYRMRDWLISRQRYWGAPIPMIHCPHCGDVPVPEEDLPVLLPYDVDFTPDGTSPLLKHEGFMNVDLPGVRGDAKRDPDTMDTFVCSSWYYLRYPD